MLKLPIESSSDLVAVRNAVGKLAEEIGFRNAQQVKIITAVSEIVRNVLNYAGTGGCIARRTSRGIRIEVWDSGPGIPVETIQAIETGSYVSKTGMGKGISGSKELMDSLSILSSPGNTQIFMEMNL